MKLFCALVLCVCFVQLCSSLKVGNDKDINKTAIVEQIKAYLKMKEAETPLITQIQNYMNGSDAIKDISPQFIENINNVLDKYQSNNFIMYMLHTILEDLAKDGRNSRITVAMVKKHTTENGITFNDADILQTILSKELSPEHVNGIINLKLMTRRNATDDEIENALGYLYGNVVQPMAIFDNLSPLNSDRDCMSESMSGTLAIVLYDDVERSSMFFKNNTKINPKVMEDINIIRERLPCNYYVILCLKLVLTQLYKFTQFDITEFDVCETKNDEILHLTANDFKSVVNLIATETVLSKRVPDKDFTGFLSLLRFTVTNSSIKGIENAFEYAFGSELYNRTIGKHPEC